MALHLRAAWPSTSSSAEAQLGLGWQPGLETARITLSTPGSTGVERTRSRHCLAAVPVGGGSSAPGHTNGATAVQNSPDKNHAGPLPVQNSPDKNHAGPLPVQNSPCSPKMALFGAFFACMANFVPLSPPTSHAGRTLYRIQAGCGASKHNNTTDHTSVKVSTGSDE